MRTRRGRKGCFFPMAAVLLLMVVGIAGFRFAAQIYDAYAYPLKYGELVDYYAKERDLQPSLVYAVICCESSFDPQASSDVGAKGLMQLMNETFDWAQMRSGEEERKDPALLYDPEVNVRYGTLVLQLLLEEFGTPENALAAYHAGWGNVKKWLADETYSKDGVTLSHILFDDTRFYVKRVLAVQEKYRELYEIL